MADKKKDCSTGSCPVVGSDDKSKLVKSSELPLHGNPYPPKDVIQDDSPGSIELAVRSIRITVQPFMTPVCAAYNKAYDIASIGSAHTQSALANLVENRGTVKNGMIIAGATLFGILFGRRKGIFKKALFGTTAGGLTALALYPQEAKEKTELAFLIAKNKLPALMQRNQTPAESTSPPVEFKSSDKRES